MSALAGILDGQKAQRSKTLETLLSPLGAALFWGDYNVTPIRVCDLPEPASRGIQKQVDFGPAAKTF